MRDAWAHEAFQAHIYFTHMQRRTNAKICAQNLKRFLKCIPCKGPSFVDLA